MYNNFVDATSAITTSQTATLSDVNMSKTAV